MTTLAVAHSSASAGFVRRRLSDMLSAWSLPEDAHNDALLIMTELVSNAIRHAHPLPDGGMQVGWRTCNGQLKLWATDGGSASEPTFHQPDPTETGGRGLAIVDALSSNWGVSHNGRSTTVWASLPVATIRKLHSSVAP